MPAVPDPITSAPPQPWQSWDVQADGSVGGWDSVDQNSGICDNSFTGVRDWPDGPGPWRQT